MRFPRCVHAEFLLVVPRLTRTRLGMTLVVSGTTLVWLSARGFDALTVTMQAGALGAILGAAAIAGDEDRPRALDNRPDAFHHALAIATGRWLAIVGSASALVMVCAAGEFLARARTRSSWA